MQKLEKYKLVVVNSRYCDYLRKFDYRVSYNSGNKELRPFVGVLLEINKCKYFAPLSSPKPKHIRMKNQVDFYKIDSGKLGAINLNNMIPILDSEYTYANINLNDILCDNERKYRIMLSNQLHWLNRHGINLRYKAKKLYENRVKNTLPERIKDRCCDFQLLEQKCLAYSNVVEKKKAQEMEL